MTRRPSSPSQGLYDCVFPSRPSPSRPALAPFLLASFLPSSFLLPLPLSPPLLPPLVAPSPHPAHPSVVIGTDLGAPLTTVQKEVITSATTLGALLGALGAGTLSDMKGRKAVLALANVVFIAGALLQAASTAVSPMVVGRFVVGLGVGLASCIAPVYIGELAPTRMRGRLVTVNSVVTTFGQVVAYGTSGPAARSNVRADGRHWCRFRTRTRRMAVDGWPRRPPRRRPARLPRLPP